LKSLLFLPNNGTALQVRRSSLCVRAPDARLCERCEATETLYPARVHGLRTIILAGRGGSITDEAIRWVAREGVSLYLMCLSGEAFAIIAEAVETNHRRRGLGSSPETVPGRP
jgi:hypothetical protein